MPPKHLRGGIPGRAATYDDDPLREIGTGNARRTLRRAFLPNEEPPVLLFHLPGGKWGRRGCPQGYAAAKVETRVMPGTANGFRHHEPLRKRAVIMRALRSDREDFRADLDEQHALIADMTKELAAH